MQYLKGRAGDLRTLLDHLDEHGITKSKSKEVRRSLDGIRQRLRDTLWGRKDGAVVIFTAGFTVGERNALMMEAEALGLNVVQAWSTDLPPDPVFALERRQAELDVEAKRLAVAWLELAEQLHPGMPEFKDARWGRGMPVEMTYAERERETHERRHRLINDYGHGPLVPPKDEHPALVQLREAFWAAKRAAHDVDMTMGKLRAAGL